MTIKIAAFKRLTTFVATLLASLILVGFWTGNIQNGAAQQLDRAAMNNQAGLMKFLLFLGTDPNVKIDSSWYCATGNSLIISHHYPLHTAAGEGGLEATQILLEHGAQVNATNEAGNTALWYAALYGRADIARLLLARGAEMNSASLEEAAEEGETEIVKLLLENDAGKNLNVDSALYKAVLFDRADTARFLMSKGANLKFAERKLAPTINSEDSAQDIRDSITALIKMLNHSEVKK